MDEKNKKIASDLAYAIIKDVGRAIRPYVGNTESGEHVKIGADGTPSSLIDIIAEEKIINILKNSPEYCYLISEEVGELRLGKGLKENITLTHELRRTDIPEDKKAKFIFLIDPLDGTNNAVKGIPAYGISVAVAKVPEGRVATLDDVELGFVSNFSNGNFFEAEKGKGTWLNNEEVHPSKVINISNTTLGGFTKSSTITASKLVDNARRMRVLGSVVLELSYVASGKYDAFLDLRGSRIIDIAASKLILEEAGGIITNKYGEKLNNKLTIYEKTIVVAANNEILHRQIVNILTDNEADIIGEVAIVSRLDEYKSILYSAKIINYLLMNGVAVVIENDLANKLEELKKDPNLPEIIKQTQKEAPEIADQIKNLKLDINYKLLSEKIDEFDSDMIIILGGDGTLLRTQSKMKQPIPIFGINMGTVGFLTEIEVKDTFKALKKILKGDYFIEKRSKLIVSHEDHQYSALNEVVIMTDKPSKMLHFEVEVDGEVVEEFRADGLIVSTPSGSTAYAMSAGGPIVDPKLEAFIIIPICPYKLGIRPFVVSDKSEIIVKLLKKGKKAIFVMDGQINEEAEYEEEIKFKKAEKDVYFIRTSKKYFYKKVKDKLTEGGIHTEPRCL
ncbi:MAG: bifunctional NADP phosphatase/NAD kinase [Methanobrevibacter sp.]|uniref:bifunctional NADP phosphatase/NAD kinase n=1 Tax=Methanobrevibacter sp. TaxID=66852 RepID=UPI0026DF467C|nr:bifunctional NADP phosphatase/NAD kinase [Methanobrevibacter sp.]MDO5848271.1 bifunctional NADP phosphatase/NAD kinase [Methanobrevibacter sp.]